ncbi:hypothetical protein [Kushneria sp. TE3]|uniref:hypothetical protein n=1 Tax=Kushneria sp. TE3 TaxID=3449832 RepID=UPI003F6856FE
MGYPPVSQGNPHKLKRKQHLYTAKLIREFASDRRVWVADLPSWHISEKSSDWRGSYKNRRWSTRAEDMAAKYESGLHGKLEDIKKRKTFRKHPIASEYFAIWRAKSEMAIRELEDLTLSATLQNYSPSLEEYERFESTPVIRLGRDDIGQAVMRGFDMTHPELLRCFGREMAELKSFKWRLVFAQEDKFIAPMSAPEHLLIPLSHDMLLYGVDKSEKHRPGYVNNQSEIDKVNFNLAKDENDWLIARSRSTLERVRSQFCS